MQLELRQKFNKYFFNVWSLWGVALLLNILTILFLYYKIHPGNKTLALHYNVLIGVQWYGKGFNLYAIPGVGLIILMVNFLFYRSIRQSEDYIPFLPAFVTACCQLILLASAVSLARVN